jgi:hypothetical protein
MGGSHAQKYVRDLDVRERPFDLQEVDRAFSVRSIGESDLREIATRLFYCDRNCHGGRWMRTMPTLQYHASAS